jgi:hypothetical protein
LHSREQIARDIRIVNGTEEGARLIGYLLDFCHVFRDSMPKSGNDNIWKINEGQRTVGNEIVSLLVNDPERFKAETLRSLARQAEGTDI